MDMTQIMSVTVSYRTFQAGTNTVEARPVHSIGIHLASPAQMIQKRDGQQIKRLFTPNDIVIVPAGMENYCSHDAPIKGLYIDIMPETLAQTAQEVDLNPDVLSLQTTFGAMDPLLAQLGQLLLQEHTASQIGSDLYQQALQQQLTLHLLRQYTTRPLTLADANITANDARQRISPALDLIHAHLADNLSLDTLATATHLTTYHFTRVFKQATGLSPHQYVLRERIEHAKVLLSTTSLSITEIAVEVGFNDQSHLHRHFKRTVGLTPRQYRKQLK